MLDETKLFDFIKIMFTKHELYYNVKDINKNRHHFMVNRFFAIKYPAAANLLNRVRIKGSAVVDSWFRVSSQFKKVPHWIWTKTKKAESNKSQQFKFTPKDETIKFFLDKNEIGMREYRELLQFQPHETLSYLEKLEKQMQVY